MSAMLRILKKTLLAIFILGTFWLVALAQKNDDKKPPKPPAPIIKIPASPKPTPKPTPKPNFEERFDEATR
jgi:hypothetical protein